jgi:hypothetical protein
MFKVGSFHTHSKVLLSHTHTFQGDAFYINEKEKYSFLVNFVYFFFLVDIIRVSNNYYFNEKVYENTLLDYNSKINPFNKIKFKNYLEKSNLL